MREPSDIDWEKLFEMAGKHAVLPLLYDYLEAFPLEEKWKARLTKEAQKTAMQTYRLLFLTKFAVGELEKADIPVVVLKGVSASIYYPVPEMRKSGDVDLLLLDAGQLTEAGKQLEKAGFHLAEEQHANHHLVYQTPDGIDIELHTMFAEPFDNEAINHYMERQTKCLIGQRCRKEIMGISLPVLPEGYQAWHLLLHMLQHFLRSGFGFKLLCDWIAFWNQPVQPEEVESFLKLVRESKLEGFFRMITSICVYELGLAGEASQSLYQDRETVYYAEGIFCELYSRAYSREFLTEILKAEEFGKTSGDRMVVMRGNSISDYIREFHHQMKLNYPKESRNICFWPLLWIKTLLRFLDNNRKLRQVTFWQVMKVAGRRSRMMKGIRLFQ